MDINDIKHLAVERIYLVPDASEGRLSYAWCDDPTPSEGMDASEAVEYVRKDVADARIAELNRECDAYCATEEAQIALRQKMERERDQAAANANRLRAALHYCNEYLYGSHLNTIGHGSKAHMEIADALGETPVTSLARRDALKQVEAMRQVAGWLSGEIDDGGECIGHDLGGEISGPTGCSSGDKCRTAGERVFKEAARVWEYKFVRQEKE